VKILLRHMVGGSRLLDVGGRGLCTLSARWLEG